MPRKTIEKTLKEETKKRRKKSVPEAADVDAKDDHAPIPWGEGADTDKVIAVLQKEGYTVEDDHGILMATVSGEDFPAACEAFRARILELGWNRSFGIRTKK